MICIPSLNSVPKITAWLLAIVMLCTNEFSLWLVLMRGTITPSLAKPSQVHINSGLFSRNRAIMSPFLYPWLLNTLAILLLYSSTCNIKKETLFNFNYIFFCTARKLFWKNLSNIWFLSCSYAKRQDKDMTIICQ